MEARGWRVPLYLGGGLAALAVIGVILAIVALASQQGRGGAEPDAVARRVGRSARRDTEPAADADARSERDDRPERDADARPESDADARRRRRDSPQPTAEASRPGDRDAGGFTGADGDYTVIIESATSQSAADTVATEAEDKGLTDVGTFNSDDYSLAQRRLLRRLRRLLHEQVGRRGRAGRHQVRLSRRLRASDQVVVALEPLARTGRERVHAPARPRQVRRRRPGPA